MKEELLRARLDDTSKAYHQAAGHGGVIEDCPYRPCRENVDALEGSSEGVVDESPVIEPDANPRDALLDELLGGQL